MFRCTTWFVVKQGFPNLPYGEKPNPPKLGAQFIAVIRHNGTETIIYRFMYPTTVASLRKEFTSDEYTIHPSRWHQARRVLFDASDERYILRGIKRFPLSQSTAPIHSAAIIKEPESMSDIIEEASSIKKHKVFKEVFGGPPSPIKQENP